MNQNENAQQEARKPRFDGTINLGHILTATMMLISGLIVWNQSQVVQAKQDVRIAYIEKTASETAESVKKVAEMQQKMAQNQERVAVTLELITKKPQL